VKGADISGNRILPGTAGAGTYAVELLSSRLCRIRENRAARNNHDDNYTIFDNDTNRYNTYSKNMRASCIVVEPMQLSSFPDPFFDAVRYETHVHNYGSAAPTTGTWVQGDIVWNSAAAASGFVGWVCVTAGTPGTWKTFGVIST